jgi:hypothetical protein
MTNEEILEMAKQANMPVAAVFVDELIAFARLIEKTTREADARICEGKYPEYSGIFRVCFDTAEELAVEIRSQK